ncbi:hypothetical protein [Polymorphospora rubra]|uniref:Uncharacterized protein n=1 Tax=Polymorphospora rubra TaxID=338584 RepID=A0A810N2A2_9ACTN|nr:hypothetical protein [Polymorphospora rubra]BCJ65675.1 hypothetical protein Prubr_26960 [Polymorphospora rubra]
MLVNFMIQYGVFVCAAVIAPGRGRAFIRPGLDPIGEVDQRGLRVEAERGGDADLLPLLLGICEDFFADAGSAVHHDLAALLQARHITGGPGRLTDTLAPTRQRLETLAEPDGPCSRQTADSHESGAQTRRH